MIAHRIQPLSIGTDHNIDGEKESYYFQSFNKSPTKTVIYKYSIIDKTICEVFYLVKNG